MFFTVNKLPPQSLLTTGRTLMMHQIKKNTTYLFSFILGVLLLSPLASSETLPANCDTAVPPTTPPEHFTNNRDGTITDNTTELMWTLCLYGQIGSDCTGTDININGGSVWEGNWDDALALINYLSMNGTYLGYGGYINEGWRLPNVKELASILEAQCSFSTLNPFVFPAASGGTVATWTSSPDRMNVQNSWAVDFNANGDAHSADRTTMGHVRLVRSSKSGGMPN